MNFKDKNRSTLVADIKKRLKDMRWADLNQQPLHKEALPTAKNPWGQTPDLEHQSRQSQNSEPPPRIINPNQLYPFNLDFPSLNMIYQLIRMTGLHKIRAAIDLNEYRFGTLLSKNMDQRGKKIWTPHGTLNVEIDMGAGIIQKRVGRAEDMHKGWSFAFFALFGAFFNQYAEHITPFYLHFVIKDSVIVPSPFPYMEVLLYGENNNGKNVLGDYSIVDTY